MTFHMLQRAAWLLVLLALGFWCISANAGITKNSHRHPIVEAITNTHRRQANASSFTAITGVGGIGSDVPIHPRLEIRELERRPDEFNIFLLGLQRWMNVSQDLKESYFQIAGRKFRSQSTSVGI
jgi:tyrosinase